MREASGPDKPLRSTAFEATPILVEGRLIFTTPFNRAIALDPETGAELWTFDPQIDKGRRFGNMMINRGGAYWRGPNAKGAERVAVNEIRVINPTTIYANIDIEHDVCRISRAVKPHIGGERSVAS